MFTSTCNDCMKPAVRRMALFDGKDDYVCYSEGYIKCFWSMCDYQPTPSNIVMPVCKTQVIAEQPCRQKVPHTPETPRPYLESILIAN